MQQTEFEAMVARMEALANANPVAYRRRVLAWAAMGYGYLMVVVLGLLALCGLLIASFTYLKWIAAKLLFVVVPGLYVLVRSLWVRFDPPEGERVTRQDAPELFALLDTLRKELKTPHVHEIIVTPELNAAVTQVPRLGFLGWHRNYLLLGLPLMKGLTIEQFTAVLAHELGHLSRGHARVGNWIYRLRQIWARLDAEFSNRNQFGAGIIRNFFNWYSPRFSATSFPFARANEFEADAAAVRLTSARAAAQALTGVNVLGRYLDQKYWPSIHEKAKDEPSPAFSPYSGFVGSTVLQVPPEERARWQADAMARLTSCADTHPSLSDRLKSIGEAAEFAPPENAEAADTLLGAMSSELDRRFDAAWRERISASWAEFHEDTRRARERLATLRTRSAAQALDENELLELASSEERVGEGAFRALELRRKAHARFPDSAVAMFVLSRQLLEAGDASGVPLGEAVMQIDAAFESHVTRLLRDFYWGRGDKEAANRWHERYAVAAQKQDEARRERDTLLTSDSFLPHALDAQQIQQLQEQLRSVPQIRQAWLVRKHVRHFPDQPLYVLGFVCAGPLQRSDKLRNAAVVADIQKVVKFPGETFILCLEGSNRSFRSMLAGVESGRLDLS